MPLLACPATTAVIGSGPPVPPPPPVTPVQAGQTPLDIALEQQQPAAASMFAEALAGRGPTGNTPTGGTGSEGGGGQGRRWGGTSQPTRVVAQDSLSERATCTPFRCDQAH